MPIARPIIIIVRRSSTVFELRETIAIACDEHDKTGPPCVFITDVFIRRLISWKLEFCTPREAGVDRVRAWETAGRCAAVDRGNRRREEIQGGLAFRSIHRTPSRRDSRVMACFNSNGVRLRNTSSGPGDLLFFRPEIIFPISKLVVGVQNMLCFNATGK